MNTDFKYVKDYKKKMIKVASRLYPEVDKLQLEEVVDELIRENLINPSVTLDNNYTHESKDTNLLAVFDWIEDRKPIVAGNGTMYKNQNEAYNPIGEMLDGFLTDRKMYKKKMFAVDDVLNPLYKYYDLLQMNTKKLANSYYGASGMPSSGFYSKWSAPATTGTAQSGISTAEQTFEAFLADNYVFINSTEALEWCDTVHKEFKECDKYIDEFIQLHPIAEVADRIHSKILNRKKRDYDLIYRYCSSLSDEELAFFYYKNNIFDFINDHDIIKELFLEIFNNIENLEYVDVHDEEWHSKIPTEHMSKFNGSSPNDWNSYVNNQYFMDPNSVPDSIKDTINVLKEYMMKYVYTRYLSPDRIYRLKNFERMVVTVIDTDSNILSLDTVINFIYDKIIGTSTFDRSDDKNEYICVNILAYIITAISTDIFLHYGKMSNVPEDYRYRYNMKNEFLFTRLVVGKNAKKRYVSKVTLREGNLVNPPKYDIKGFDFKKSNCTDYAEKKYLSLIKKYILCEGDIDIPSLLKDLTEFKKDIEVSLRKGETEFVPNATVKDPSAYSDPESQPGVRGTVAWNLLNSENMLEYPAKISLLKLNIMKPSDIDDLKETNPDIYNILIDKVFGDRSGLFTIYEDMKPEQIPEYISEDLEGTNWAKSLSLKVKNAAKKYNIPEKSGTCDPLASIADWNKYVKWISSIEYKVPKKENGLSVIAIPDSESIPEWLMPYIDYSTVINDILAPFIPLLKIFKVKNLSEGKNTNNHNRKTETFTNIIKF